MVNNFNCRGFGPLLEDKLCLIFKLAPSVCRMTFPILASLLVRLVVLLPFQLLRLSLATPSRWTPLALSVFLHCVVRSEERFSRNAETDLVCRLLLEKKNLSASGASPIGKAQSWKNKSAARQEPRSTAAASSKIV